MIVPPDPFPGEIWTLILFETQNPTNLSKSCRFLYKLSHSPYIIASWIIFRYTKQYAFLGALHWWLQKSKSRHSIHKCVSDPCPLEKYQLQVAEYLFILGACTCHFERYLLKDMYIY